MRQKKCPFCGGKFYVGPDGGSEFFPFCSQRCRDADLGRWFSEGYSVPVETQRVARLAAEHTPDHDGQSGNGAVEDTGTRHGDRTGTRGRGDAKTRR